MTRIRLILILLVFNFGLSELVVAQSLPDGLEDQAHSAAPGSILEQQAAKAEAMKPALKFKKHGGIVYRKTDTYELKCDVYVPEGDGPFPAIIAIHGGAWRSGTKFALLRHAWRMSKSGYVVVAVNYRHAPKDPFPAQVHDCKHAVRWIRANSKQFKVDGDRIGAFGYSAGGHLVSMLGTTDANDNLEGPVDPELKQFSTRVQAVAAGGAPCEFSWLSKSNPVLSYWLGGSKKARPKAYHAASPLTYVSKDDPPFFLFHGESDLVVPGSSSLKFHEALTKVGVPSQHYIAGASGHLATFSDMELMDRAIKFFDSTLKNQKNR